MSLPVTIVVGTVILPIQLLIAYPVSGVLSYHEGTVTLQKAVNAQELPSDKDFGRRPAGRISP